MKRLTIIWERLCAWVSPHRGPLSFWLIWGTIVWRYLSCGIDYCWQHDDYIQYINFPSVDNYAQLLEEQGLLAARPLAAVSDLWFWSKFAGTMIVGVLLLSLLYAGSAMIWLRVFHRRFGTGTVFTVIYTLLPLGFEGSYWMSAGTRLICGLFFGALAAWLLVCFVEDKRLWAGLFYFPVLLLSYGYYEQTLVLSMAASLLLMLDYLVCRQRRAWLALLTFVGAVCYFCFTAQFAGTGALSGRMEIAWPTTPYYFKFFLPDIAGQIWQGLFVGLGKTSTVGVWRGLALIFADGKWLWLAVAMLLCVLYGIFARHHDGAEESRVPGGCGRIIWAYGFGILLTAAPLSLFFFIGNPWFSVRNALPCFLGIGFLVDLTLRLCLRRFVRLRGVICAALALVFCIGSVAEMQDYRATYDHDVLFLDRLTALIETEDLPDGKIGILGANPSYLDEQTFYFNGHITGITSSDWELYGALSATLGHEANLTVIPLPSNESFLWQGWNRAARQIDSFASLWYWDVRSYTLRALVPERDEQGITRLYFADDGSFLARVWEEQASNGEYFGYIRFTE